MNGDETVSLGERCFAPRDIDRSTRLLKNAEKNRKISPKLQAKNVNPSGRAPSNWSI